ncbi:MAG TPA: transcription antitermination factor NusB, partial [Chlamydiales bacterium]|nr:transcription antitermination factor NusB [Chlamydiales bacterium]
MALHQQKFREIVFQLLFSSQFGFESGEETALMLMAELKVTKRSVKDALDKTSLILEKLSEIDGKLREASEEYQVERISLAEKCALRLGIFELFYEQPTLPRPIAISEAIRITRKFGSKEGAQFVN